MSQEIGVDPADLISFMLELSFHETGQVLESSIKDRMLLFVNDRS